MYFYNLCFKETESTIMLIICCFVNVIGNVNSMLLVRGFTFGMSPDGFVFLSNTVTDTLNNCIQLLSGNVLFAKLIPANIEASMFAILTGVINLCHFFIAKQLANFINLFVGVTDENLDKLWILFAITAVCSLIPIAFIWLVPSRKEVFLVQQVNEFVEKHPHKGLVDENERESVLQRNRKEVQDAIMKLDPTTAKQMGIYELYEDELGPGFEHPTQS